MSAPAHARSSLTEDEELRTIMLSDEIATTAAAMRVAGLIHVRAVSLQVHPICDLLDSSPHDTARLRQMLAAQLGIIAAVLPRGVCGITPVHAWRGTDETAIIAAAQSTIETMALNGTEPSEDWGRALLLDCEDSLTEGLSLMALQQMGPLWSIAHERQPRADVQETCGKLVDMAVVCLVWLQALQLREVPTRIEDPREDHPDE